MKFLCRGWKNILWTILSCLSLSLNSCATIFTGTSQDLFIDTPTVQNASCSLEDNSGENYHLPSSPGKVLVHKGNGPLSIVCTKEGYETGAAVVDDEMSKAMIGNIILPGGSIGMLIDAASGAAHRYPNDITVWMKPFKWASQKDRDSWHKKKEAYDRALAEKAQLMKDNYEESQECC